MCAGADAVVGYVCQATLDPGDEVVTAWPSFPSYVLDPMKLAAVPVRVPLREEHVDLDALLAAVTPRTKLVFIAAPNNPTGTTNDRAQLDAYFDRVPPHVLTVLDQAYFEYIDDEGYPEGIAEYLRAGHRVLVLRTFSKIYGLAGLRVGYGVGPEDVITAIGKVRRAFDVTSVGQEAALASLAASEELARRRDANADAMRQLVEVVRGQHFEPAGPAVANFLFVRIGDAALRTTPSSAAASSSARWGRSARRTHYASRRGLRTRSRCSPKRSPTCRPSRQVKSSRRFVGIRPPQRESRPVAELSSGVGRPPGARALNGLPSCEPP